MFGDGLDRFCFLDLCLGHDHHLPIFASRRRRRRCRRRQDCYCPHPCWFSWDHRAMARLMNLWLLSQRRKFLVMMLVHRRRIRYGCPIWKESENSTRKKCVTNGVKGMKPSKQQCCSIYIITIFNTVRGSVVYYLQCCNVSFDPKDMFHGSFPRVLQKSNDVGVRRAIVVCSDTCSKRANKPTISLV